jgi:hypothetical protein
VMTNLEADKFNIAWFKLAEFVARKERERAFAIYRLLVHSLPHGAIAAQLEGDLFLAFHDEKAIPCYLKAAELYYLDSKIPQAIAVCEHCVTLFTNSLSDNPENKTWVTLCFKQLIRLYHHQENSSKLARTLSLFINHVIQNELYQDFLSFLEEQIQEQSTGGLLILAEQALLLFIQLKGFPEFLETPLKALALKYNERQSSLFITKLQQINQDASTYALEIINKINTSAA